MSNLECRSRSFVAARHCGKLSFFSLLARLSRNYVSFFFLFFLEEINHP